MARICPPPATVRVGEVDLYPMYRLSLVLLLGLQDELLEDGVIPRDNGHGDDLATGVVLAPALYAQPVTAVVDGVGGVGCRLEDDACLDATRRVVILFLLVAEGVVGYTGAETGRGRTRRGLKLARTLPLGATGEPEHEPVVRVILFREVGGKEERWGGRKQVSR